ncbi:hypothetical protein [Gloeothece verrucosa]|uniref:Uncharacterized protein n=1 Tax=Gloeothece verrucosa (strain PCC 7822) TaxID=497965 RepID=E0U6X8_GLOV7|nr:hypothetical protein [Gloeothece verrucosa]ADN16015.1 hypothetical protein Cyan7822_4095 [Gloeothece verrucosa PCC 7822]
MAITLCSGAGIWEVSVDLPVYSPPKINFNWNDGAGWQEINGTDYLISQVSGVGDGDEVLVSYTYSLKNSRRTIITTKSEYFHYPVTIVIRYEDGWNNLYIVDYFGDNFLIGVDPTQASIINYSILSITPTGAGGATQYNLKIFNNDSVVYSKTRSNSPSVEKVAASCQFNGLYTPVYSEVNLDPNAFLTSEINGKTIILKRCLGAVQNNQISSSCSQVASVSGSCAAPKIKASQEPLCPPGTCPLKCGDCLCCYNEYGYSVKSYCGGAEV